MEKREPATGKIERRVLAIELRAEDVATEGETKGKRLVGHAAVFGAPTQIGPDSWGWVEEIAPGAFAQSIAEDDIRALWNHNWDLVLGRNTAKTLTLAEDDKGLAIEIDPPDTQWGRDALVTVGRGDVSQMSYAFESLEEVWTFNSDKPDHRLLKRAKLWEVSPCTFPAFPTTDIGVAHRSAFLASLKPDPAVIAARSAVERENRARGLKLLDLTAAR